MDSTGEPQTGAADPDGTEVLAEEHWTAKDSRITRVCREAVAGHPGTLRSVAHYTHGALDFVVRPGGSAPLSARRAAGGKTDQLIAEGRPGRHLVVCMEDLNQDLRKLGTGELMRLVVGTPAGGMYAARIRGGQHLTGITLSGEGVERMDACLNEAVRVIRAEVHHLPDELLGGSPGLAMASPAGVDALHFEVDLETRGSGLERRLRGVWHGCVNPVDLQYAAYYRDWAMVCAGDSLDDPRLGLGMLHTPSRNRRLMYRDLASRLRADVSRLWHALRPVVATPVDRLVLDVQEGAVYVHWTGSGPGTFLLGVTTDQYQVDVAERRLRSLFSGLTAAQLRG